MLGKDIVKVDLNKEESAGWEVSEKVEGEDWSQVGEKED